MTVVTTPYCAGCGWDFRTQDLGKVSTPEVSDSICDSCGLPASAGGIYPTGVTAGTPGSFTPTTTILPKSLGHLQSLGALGATTLWTVGQNVVLGDGTTAHWNGTAWATGAAPA